MFTPTTYRFVANNRDLVRRLENIRQLLHIPDTCWRLSLCRQLTVATLRHQRTPQICPQLRYYADAVIITSTDICVDRAVWESVYLTQGVSGQNTKITVKFKV